MHDIEPCEHVYSRLVLDFSIFTVSIFKAGAYSTVVTALTATICSLYIRYARLHFRQLKEQNPI